MAPVALEAASTSMARCPSFLLGSSVTGNPGQGPLILCSLRCGCDQGCCTVRRNHTGPRGSRYGATVFQSSIPGGAGVATGQGTPD